MNFNKLEGLGNPTSDSDAANKAYVDTSLRTLTVEIPRPVIFDSTLYSFSASSTWPNSAYSPSHAFFDNNKEWVSQSHPAQAWLEVRFPVAIGFWRITLKGRTSSPNEHYGSFELKVQDTTNTAT